MARARLSLLFLLVVAAQAFAKVATREGRQATLPAETVMKIIEQLVPGVDYPIFDEVPKTAFDCPSVLAASVEQSHFASRGFGYFADVEAQCQVFHVCARQLLPAGDLIQQFSVCF